MTLTVSYRLAVASILLVAAWLRFQAGLTEFWLDEVWSLHTAAGLHSMMDVFRIHHDNNHYLNTIWMYWMGDHSNWVIYRIPSLLCGMATVVGLTLIGARRSPFHAITLALLSATSFFLILYSSEARGYAVAAAMAVLCLDLHERYLRHPGIAPQVGFSIAAVAGFLAHLTFALSFTALMFHCLYTEHRRTGSWRSALGYGVRIGIVPALAVLALYLVDLRYIEIGWAPEYSVKTAIFDLMTVSYGLAFSITGGLVALGISIAALLRLTVASGRGVADGWILYATSLFVIPALVFAHEQFHYVYPRYFFVCYPFLLLMLTDAMATLRSTKTGRRLAAALITSLVAANGISTLHFFRDGRGHYIEAFGYLARHSQGAAISIGATRDFGMQLMIGYYQRFLPPPRSIIFHPYGAWSCQGPEWVISEAQDLDDEADSEVADITRDGCRFTRVALFPYSGRYSGFNWYLYRLVSRN